MKTCRRALFFVALHPLNLSLSFGFSRRLFLRLRFICLLQSHVEVEEDRLAGKLVMRETEVRVLKERLARWRMKLLDLERLFADKDEPAGMGNHKWQAFCRLCLRSVCDRCRRSNRFRTWRCCRVR